MDTKLAYYITGIVIFLVFYYLARKKPKPSEEASPEQEIETKLSELSERLEKNFEAITNKSLAQNAEFVQNLSTNGVDVVLRPLISQLKEYEGKMKEMIQKDATGREHLSHMIKCVNDINMGFSEEAKRFTQAVRGNIHAIGRFGEDTLENIFQASGLTLGRDYLKQETFKNEVNDRLRPDFVLLAPNGRGVVIDSKLSLDSFMRYMESDTEEQKERFSGDLARNVNNHVAELSKKEYQKINSFSSFDYVMLFLASDSALALALSVDKELIRNALKKGVLIVGPTSLMTSIKTVEFLWKEQRQVENFKELGQSGQRLYDKCFHMIERIKDVQKHFIKAGDSLDTALNHLGRGNSSIVNEALRLKELGIHSDKEIKAEKQSK